MIHIIHRVLFKVLESSETSCKNLVITSAGFIMDVKCKATGQEYDLFLLPKEMTKGKEIHLLDKTLRFSDFERSQS